jgi:hypothetical protein
MVETLYIAKAFREFQYVHALAPAVSFPLKY